MYYNVGILAGKSSKELTLERDIKSSTQNRNSEGVIVDKQIKGKLVNVVWKSDKNNYSERITH